jgi:hypothetical protein
MAREIERNIYMETESTKIINHMDIYPGNLFMPVEPVQIMPVEPVQTECAENPSRRRSWMIHSHFKCPVVGTCLSLEEQKRILKKTGHSIKNRTGYEIHGIFVHSLSNKNTLSKRIDAYLQKKFKYEISEFFGLDRSLFLDAWKTHFRKGEKATAPFVHTRGRKSKTGSKAQRFNQNKEKNEKRKANFRKGSDGIAQTICLS